MSSRDQENEALMETLEKSEAGVADVFAFYVGIEAVYAASVQALEQGEMALASDATNHE